ncbi:MAG: hypothetical protein DI533_13675 [Cereibacter sphaeroides]|uniref:Nucleotide-diphospho-sugar transferase domain-containing protein n=1 Tax=Cereibacter sphaeroides TaxID=1063 RepID=A0A2W5SBR0_CERSP|nr:MAG: hypothetical protein DI533_13675 [Cereibacter sphaeroides]
MRDGIIYVAAGPGYLDLAIRSAASLKALNPGLPIDLYTDQAVTPGLFDHVRPIPDGPTPKLAALPATRFERTLYLDCDTLCLAPLGDLFGVLERFELALAHDVRRTSALIREGVEERPPYAFPQMNAGVMLYRRSDTMMGFLAEWRRRYVAAGRDRDQPTLRDLLWASDLRFYVLPPEFNLRRVTVLDAWEPLDARPTMLHSHRLLQHLRGDAPQLDSLAEVLPEERLARAAEWRLAGLPDPAAGGDAVEAFLRAEKEQ